jgi:bifunctional N-acetylglucosamine-1-phosphate-uridyltransferase/glucosamine-1-phosphate-acetyltransferase GlmU-like protein
MHSTNASQQATLVTLLRNNGVIVLDERQLYVDDDVLIENIFPGTMIYPGVRLHGAKTVIGPGAKIGTEGPATLMNVAVGRNAEIASGFVTEAAILSNARLGSNSHVRSGTLLEEWASTAHSVGLKHTVLMSFVTMGSLINLCDCLVSGGRSRREHSEIGSGFIHFNFTPWGPDGDKATRLIPLTQGGL